MVFLARTLNGTDTPDLSGILGSIDTAVKAAPDQTDLLATLLVDREVGVAGPVIIPPWLELRFLGSGCIVPTTPGAWLGLHRVPRAGLWQVFGKFPGDELPDVEFLSPVPSVFPDWWGGRAMEKSLWVKAVAQRPGMARAFQAAIDSLRRVGGQVHAAPGTYFFTTSLRMRSNTSLLGDGVNITRLRWFDSDGIEIPPDARNVSIGGLQIYRIGRPMPGVFAAVRMQGGEDVRIQDVAISPVGQAAFQFGILQQEPDPARVSPMRRLRIEDTSVVCNRDSGLIVMEACEDVLLDRVTLSRLVPKDVPNLPSGVGVTIGSEQVGWSCTDVRLVDCTMEFLATDVLVVKADGVRLDFCSLEPNYEYVDANGVLTPMTTQDRQFIRVDPGTSPNPALSGEGLEVGYCYFRDTYGYQDEKKVVHKLNPIEHVVFPAATGLQSLAVFRRSALDRRMTRVFRFGGWWAPDPGDVDAASEPPTRVPGMYVQVGDVFFNADIKSPHPGQVDRPIGWVCVSHHLPKPEEDRTPEWVWVSFGPTGPCGPRWRSFGSLEP